MGAKIENLKSKQHVSTQLNKTMGVSHHARRTHNIAKYSDRLLDIPTEDLTPEVKSAVTILMDEVESLKTALKEAHQRVHDLEHLADEDPLVPVLNRRGFMRELERTIDHIKRYKTNLSLLYIDLDDFKTINDTHGHNAGDTALQHISDFLINLVRRSDVLGRLGGDEFAIILQYTDQSTAITKARQLTKRITNFPCNYNDIKIPLALTVGVTQIQAEDTPVSVLERADQDMYRIRSQRRDRG
ncbi:MAG: GGDEF domain-containing protein [Pseudomonadota bacterium]